MNQAVYKHDGVEVKIGRTTYCAAPLNLRSLKVLLPKLKGAEKRPELENFDLMVEVLLHSLQRNHPDLTTEALEDELTSANIYEVVNTVMKASGLELGNVTAPPRPTETPSTSAESTGS